MAGGEVVIEKNPSQKFCLEEKELLCNSIIWKMLKNYYDKTAINAWKDNAVPSFVTSNSKLAKDYARVIVNYMKDWFNSNECDRNVPIYILEVGAGHGKFTYLILRALSKYKKYYKSMNLPPNPFVYVFTDVAKSNIEYCMNNEYLKKYISQPTETNIKEKGKEKRNSSKKQDKEAVHSLESGDSQKSEEDEDYDYDDSDSHSNDDDDDDDDEVEETDEEKNIMESRTKKDTNLTIMGEQKRNNSNNRNNATSNKGTRLCSDKKDTTNKNSEEIFFSILDFAFFDGNETTDKIYLEIAKKYIPENTPIVLICNYVLDSLLTDAWIVSGENSFKRALLSVYYPKKEEDITDDEIMLRMTVKWDWKSVNIDEESEKKETEKESDYLRKYKDIYKVLKLYSYFNQYLSFVFPVGAFILFKRMLKLSGNKLLCLIGDKGYQSHDEFIGYRNPHMVVHGSLSFMVNLNAICLFFLSLGGYYIYTPYSDNFQILTLLMHKKTSHKKLNYGNYQKNINSETNKLERIEEEEEEQQQQQEEKEKEKATEKEKEDESFDIIQFFKKNIYTEGKRKNVTKGKQEQEAAIGNGILEDGKIKDEDKNREQRTYEGTRLKRITKRKVIDVHKKLRKINLQNLNNMTINFGGTVTSFYDNTEQFPPDVLIAWQKSVLHNISHNSTNVKMKELISLLRYSNYDSDVFYNMRTSFLQLACYPNINGRTEKDILLDIKECYKNYYSLKNDEDIADVCGHLCMKFGKFKKSIYYLKESLRKFKHIRHSSTYINIASCYKILGKYKKAVKFIIAAIQLAQRENKNDINNSSCNFHSSELLYSIQFCNNPITYAIIGVNYYIQNDGLYYLIFENRIKLKYIFLLSQKEEKTLKLMYKKLFNTPKGKTNKNINLSDVVIIKVYDGNSVLSITNWEKKKKKIKENKTGIQEKVEKIEKAEKKEKGEKKKKTKKKEKTEKKNRNIETGQETNHVEISNKMEDMKSSLYLNWEKLKTNLQECLNKFDFQFCVIDAPWKIKPDLIHLALDHLKHIYTYGVVSDNFKQSLEVLIKYKTVANQLSWINNNYIHDDCIYEARKLLTYYVEKVLFLNIVHFSKNAYTNMNPCISTKEILIDELCIFINKLSMILDMGLVSVTANVLTKNKIDKTKKNLPGGVRETIQVNDNSTLDSTVSTSDSTSDHTSSSTSNDTSDNNEHFQNENMEHIYSDKKKENKNKTVASLTGLLAYSEKESDPSSETAHGNYIIINDMSEEFITKINIVGTKGTMKIKTSLTSWTITVTDMHDEKVYEKSGRITSSQNANDIFINQFLIKTNGEPNKIKHISEYIADATSKKKKEEKLVSEDSDNDILIVSDKEENKTVNSVKKHFKNSEDVKETTQTEMDHGVEVNIGKKEELTTNKINKDQENNEHKTTYVINCNKNNTIIDSNLQVLKELPGSRFYYVGKEIYENLNLDKSLVDMTVNKNGLTSTYVEGIIFSTDHDGRMVNFVPRS